MDKHLINLLNYGFTIAKKLLQEQSEFYPIAVYLNKNNQPLQHIVFFGDEFPLSTELIKQLETDLTRLFGDQESLTYAIIYNTLVTRPSIEGKTDAIIAKFYSHLDKHIGYYFLPYEIEEDQVILHEGWLE
ncbi:hypothetical protein GJU39_11365 [Pedobacter petrophilus]|uniref:Uncharacterized protein n=1 Tax=Pedobacter petrophilus TaxID=1908241 RepID=A0A7K0G138_9SPHI|nr:hypothetical protein [Pedobacter petrophilus]MRX76686.1 hypothetical protein [Pedobacter petrophilus]